MQKTTTPLGKRSLVFQVCNVNYNNIKHRLIVQFLHNDLFTLYIHLLI